MANKFLTNIELNAGLVDVNGNTGTSGQILSSTGGGVDWVSLSEISGVDGTGTANYVAKWSDVDTITNSVIYDNGTNVGIGTAFPGARLEVKSAAPNTFFADFISSTGSGFVNIYENSNSHPLLYMADATGTTTVVLNSSGVSYLISGNIIIGGTADNGNLLQVQGTGYFDGNVGIGTPSPGAKLDIINSSLSEMFRLSNTAANATTKYGAILGRHYTNAEENVTGMLITSTSSATGGSVSIGGGISAANAVNNVLFYTAANNTTLTGTERMRITPSGNVGINTTSPNQKLHVNGATQLGDINAATNFGTVALKVVEGTVSTGPTLGSGAVGAQAVLYSNGAFGMYTGVNGINGNTWMQSQRNDGNTAAYSLLFQPSGGNVGIGTSSPVAKLDIGGASGEMIRLADSSTIGNPFISFFQTSTRRSYVQHVDSGDNLTLASEYGGIVLMTGTGGTETEKMRVDITGNVGIGTTIPTSRVHSVTDASGPVTYDNLCAVFGDHTNTSLTYNNGIGVAGRVLTSGGKAIYGDATSGGGWGGYFDGKGYFSGNVGIGTTTSSYPLDVNGIAMLRGNLYMTAGGGSSVPNWSFFINGSGDLVVDESITTKNFIFSNSGQVLIGTTVGGTPTYGSAPQFVTSSTTGGVIDIRSLNTNIVADSLLGRIQFTGKDDLSVGYTSAAIEAVSAGTNGQGSNGGGTLKFMTSANGYSTNPLPRMWISYLGYVTIGSTNTNSYPLRVTTQVSNTSIYADYDIVAYSDQSVKENIRPIENVIERVQKSRGVLYDRIDSESKDNIGFIAQELEVAFPELVVTNEDGTKAVKYQNAVAVLFEAVKEQQKQIDEIKQILNGLTN